MTAWIPAGALACALAAGLALGGCGGGQVAGQDASAPTTQTATAATTAATTPAGGAATTDRRSRHARTTATTAPATTPSTTPTSGSPATPAGTTRSTTTTTHPAKAAPKPPAKVGTPVEETAQLTLVSKQSATRYTQRGTVTGTFSGEMTLDASIETRGIVVHFTVDTASGAVTGHGIAIVHITGATLEPITGTAAIDSGTGKFAGAHATGLKVDGRVALDASRGVVHLTGTILY